MRAQLLQGFALVFDFAQPVVAIDVKQRTCILSRDTDIRGTDHRWRGHQTDGRLVGATVAIADLVAHPAQHAQVLAEAGPDVVALVVSTEPVDLEDRWR